MQEFMIESDKRYDNLVSLTEDRHDICHILICFEHMGATIEELEAESVRLIHDVNYCDSWLKATGFFAS